VPLDEELEEEEDAVALAAAALVEPVAASYEVEVVVVLEMSPPEDDDSPVTDAADEGPDSESWCARCAQDSLTASARRSRSIRRPPL
jgi:hypothetical protein